VNRGTLEGEKYEKDFCIRFNRRDPSIDSSCLDLDIKDTYAVHVIGHKYSQNTQRNVKPKSDAFLVNLSQNDFADICKEEFYINEKSFVDNNIQFIKNSGISIKNKDSKSFQWYKFTFDSFLKTFEDKFLFIGIQTFTRSNAIFKNESLLENFGLSKEEYFEHFQKFLYLDGCDETKYKEIDKHCKDFIEREIKKNDSIRELVFSGKGVFEDPFYASYFFQDDVLKPMNPEEYEFYLTTGSGRTKAKKTGDYTVVVKPSS
tara:strand:+ start:649 stop:1428 length:780 start_codon:yes stop_codon:yes gene_type:complete